MPRKGEGGATPPPVRDLTGDIRVAIPAQRVPLLKVLATMPEEAYAWLVLACQPAAQPLGANAQIWPDGIGGFQGASRAAITAVRDAASAYLEGASRP